MAHGNLDSGTFVLDAMGERWASELGADDYNITGYFDNAGGGRWQYYRCTAQGQNVIAMNPVTETGQTPTGFTTIERFETKERGGFAVGVATDEKHHDGRVDAWKRERLIRAGADVIIPDFARAAELAAYLFPQG